MIRSALQAVALVAFGSLALANTAKADIQFDERGSVGYLTSFHLRPGDEQSFAEFLDRPRPQPLRIIYMNSRGGNPGDEPGKRTLFFTGSRSAVRAGVATGTSVPPGLRD